MDPLNLNSIVFNQKRETYENSSLEITRLKLQKNCKVREQLNFTTSRNNNIPEGPTLTKRITWWLT